MPGRSSPVQGNDTGPNQKNIAEKHADDAIANEKKAKENAELAYQRAFEAKDAVLSPRE